MSLRDVERVLEVMSWFYSQTQGETDLFDQMEDVETDSEENDEEEELAEDMEMEDQIVPLHQVGTNASAWQSSTSACPNDNDTVAIINLLKFDLWFTDSE